MPTPKKTLAVGAFAAALAGGAALGATLGVPALSSAQSPSTTVPSTSAPSTSAPDQPGQSGDLGGFGGHHGRGPGDGGPNGEKALTGTDKAKAAAVAALPGGTVKRVSTDTDGANGAAFEAHVTKSDSSEVEVQLDKDCKVLTVNPGHGPGGLGHGFGGRGGPWGPGRHGGEAPLTGTDADKAKAAAVAAVPGGTVQGVSKEVDATNGAAFEAHVTKSDGSEVEVQLDKDFKVLSVTAGHGPGDHGPGGPH